MRNYLFIGILSILFLFPGVNNAFGQDTTGVKKDTSRAPQTFALIMGISKYRFVPPLEYADKDAEMFRDYLKSAAGGKVPADNMYCLFNEEAKSINFWVQGLAWLKSKKLIKGDKLFIYLSGHGDAIDEDQFFFLTYDCNPAGDKNNYLVGGVLQLFNLKKKIAIETGKGVDVYFIMDACRSGELPGGTEGQNFLNEAISQKRAGEIIMLATGAGQQSLEDPSIGKGHGLFTYYLVDGLNGMADQDGNKDNKITLEEIQKYVDKNVPAIAQEKFRKKQDPFFCCNDNVSKTITNVDSNYYKTWLKNRLTRGPGNSFIAKMKGYHFSPADTLLIETYNHFTDAVKESKLTGKGSAEYYYDILEKKFPQDAYTITARQTLAVEFVNFAQNKINLYLQCQDVASIQKIRSQIDQDEQSDDVNNSLDRMEKVARQEFFEVGQMMEKAINFIKDDDPDLARSLEGRMYFFKARGYFGRGRRMVDINNAFQFAYQAYASNANAAYVLETLAALHMDNNRIDSGIYYAKKALQFAPKWRYPYLTLAFAYKTLNRPDSALKYYRGSVQLDRNNADAYVDIGHYFHSLGRADSAISYYQQALRLDPSNVYASNNIGWLYHDRKRYDSAILYFKRSIHSDPKFINAYNGLSKTFFETKLYDSARVYYEKAFANYTDKSIVNVYIGNFYKDLKEYDSAKVYYRFAANLDPNYEDAWISLGRIGFDQKQYDSAQYYYQKALQINPFSAASLINIGLVQKELKNKDSTYIYFQRAIQVEPKNASVLNTVGVIYGQDKSYDSAKSYFRRALQVQPDYTPASNNLIKIFKDMKDLDSVTNFLKTSGSMDANSVSMLNDLAQVFLQQKRYDSARIYYRRAISQDPSNAMLYNNLALVFREMKNYDSSRILLQKAMRLDPENPTMWINIAKVFGSLREIDSAAYYYKKQLFLRKDVSPQAYFNVGSFYDDIKVYDSAIVYYKKALEMDHNYLPALNNIGGDYMNLEIPDSAFLYYKKAVGLDPTSENASLNLGLLYHSQQKYDSAIVNIKRAIALDPTKGKNYFRLACSYALNNQNDQAIDYLRQAYERGYKNYDALLSDPDLSSLKNIKGFQDLLDKYIPDWRKH